MDLPNSLLSRFDLLFLILDRVDTERDLALSRHVLHVHKYQKNPGHSGNTLSGSSGIAQGSSSGSLSAAVVKKYIATARQLEPTVSPDVAPYIVENYVELRSKPTDYRTGRKNTAADNSDQTTMTARQLLSILRLSQGLARLRLSRTVANQDIDEAIRLVSL